MGFAPSGPVEVVQHGFGPVGVQFKYRSALLLARAALVAASVSGGAVQVPGGVHEQAAEGLRSICRVASKTVEYLEGLALC